MNNPGDFMVTLPNSLHSPDAHLESTVKELKILYNIGAFDYKIDNPQIFEEIDYFNSMELLKKI